MPQIFEAAATRSNCFWFILKVFLITNVHLFSLFVTYLLILFVTCTITLSQDFFYYSLITISNVR